MIIIYLGHNVHHPCHDGDDDGDENGPDYLITGLIIVVL
jgi:hypothetical protein